jgi:hypothetical protein
MPRNSAGGLMEAIVARDNLKKALARVKRNKRAPTAEHAAAKIVPFATPKSPDFSTSALGGFDVFHRRAERHNI